MTDTTAEAIPDRSRTRAFLENLCALGPRLMGTAQEERARSFLADFFRGLGLDPFVQAFPVPLYERGATACTLVTGNRRETLQALAVERCPATRNTVDLPLVAVGDGSGAAVEAVSDSLRGCAAFPSKPGSEGFLAAARAGAAAWIEPCAEAFDAIRAAYMREGSEESACPRVKIRASAGKRIEEAFDEGEAPRVELRVEGEVRESRSANLEFTLPGATDLPHVLVGAHLDTFSIATGATDNGSGVAAACMIAQALASLPPSRRGVRFLFFTGEEDGRRGSKAYVDSRLPRTHPAGVYVNFDVPHGGKPLIHVMSGTFDAAWFEDLRSRFGEDLAFARNMRRSSDHYSFYRASVPCVMPRAVPADERENPGTFIHTPLDTIDRVDVDALQRSIVLSARLTHALADAERLPFDLFEPLPDEAANFPDPG